MATNLSKFVGQFFATTSGTTQSVTAPGFQPKVVIFLASDRVASGSLTSADVAYSLGFSDGTNHRDFVWSGQGAVSTSAGCTYTNNAFCITLGSVFTSSFNKHGSIAMTSTGFDVTWDVTPVAASVINYIALGGSDVGNVAIGTGTMPTTAIAKAITGLGFTPTFVMLLSGSQTGNNDGAANNAHGSYGCAISTTKRFAHALGVQNAQTMSANVNGVSVHNSDACLQGVTAGAALEYKADFTSFDAGTGFTITFSTAPASAYQFYYLAIGGANLNWDISTATRPTTAAAQSKTGLSFKPEVAWWSNSDLPTLNTITSNAALAIGASDGTNTQSLYATHNDAINTVAGTQSAAKACQDGVPANTSVLCTFTSFDSGGWTITWDGTGAANQISAVSLAGTTIAGQTVGEMVASAQYGQSQPIGFNLQIVDY